MRDLITRSMIKYREADNGAGNGGNGGSGGSSGGESGNGSGSGANGGGAGQGGEGGSEGGEGGSEGGEGGESFKAPKSQAELDAMFAGRLERDRKTQRAALEKEIRDKIAADARAEEAAKNGDYKTLYETLQGEHEKLKGEVEGMKREATVSKLAAKHKIPADLFDLVKGDTEAEIEASIKKLAKHVGAKPPADTEGGEGSGKGAGRGRDEKEIKFRAPALANWPSD